jgi:hypothetical protein
MAETVPNPNEGWRNYTKRVSIGACKLGADDLKKLYRLINEKQIEAGKSVVAGFWKTEQETDEQFQERCTRWKDAFVTTMQVKGFNNEVVTGQGETFFDSGLLPERLLSVEYDTSFSPKALAASRASACTGCLTTGRVCFWTFLARRYLGEGCLQNRRQTTVIGS